MKLVLSGGGDSKYFVELDQKFISLLGSTPRLLFIPLAGDKEYWDDGLERIVTTFSTIKFHDIEMCLDLSELDWGYLSKFDAVYIDGGNTFQLMSKIRKTHTYELLHRFLHHGGVINGDSAGAIVLGSHLETAHFGDYGDDNEAGVTSYQGLNLLGSWAIHAHYNENEDAEIQDFVENFGFPVIALKEESGIIVNDGEIKVCGSGSVSIFLNGEKFTLEKGDEYFL